MSAPGALLQLLKLKASSRTTISIAALPSQQGITVRYRSTHIRLFLLFICIVFSGCAMWLPAAVSQLEEGVYQLSTTGNAFASSEKMKAKLDKKADSLCEGKGFEYRKRATTEWKEQKDYSTGMTTDYQRMHMIVECN